MPPKLQLLLLSTAGTGKTHTAKIGITEVRIALGSCDSVLTMAFSRVADAGQDLAGVDLDNLVNELQNVQLIVIDEISTCGAASLEVVSRRMQQVARVVWRVVWRLPTGSAYQHGVVRRSWCVAYGRFCSDPTCS